MKTKSAHLVVFLVMSFCLLFSMKSFAQDTETFEGTFDSHESYGYDFIGVDEDDIEYTMTFHKIDKKLLDSFNLNSDTLVGERFLVTYQVTTETIKDEDDYEEDIDTYTIVGLKKL